MTALALIRDDLPATARHALSPADRHVLGAMRLAALRCRSAARLDLFRACEMLGADRAAAAEVATDALLRTLGEALGRSPRFFRPGCRDVSFDEQWLLALLRALGDGDEPSATFLLFSRVPPHARRSVVFLAGRVAAGLLSRDVREATMTDACERSD